MLRKSFFISFAFIILSLQAFAAPESFAPIVKSTKDSIVHINVITDVDSSPYMMDDDIFRWFFGAPDNPGGSYESKSSGTGFIIDSSGYVITNNHVIDKAKKIIVKTSDNSEYEAKLVGRDSLTDLALLQIESAKGVRLKALSLGDSDAVEIGDWVIAIGSPQGLEWSVTAGIVSAKGRDLSSGPYDSFIQTDASINPGNSGGPLLNTNGEVIGINSMIYRNSQGLGFAVPINILKTILPQLQSGQVRRGLLGITLQNIDSEIAKSLGLPNTEGALVVEVLKGEPAEKYGVKSGDIIKKIDSTDIKDFKDATQYIGSLMPGQVVKLSIIRDGKAILKTVTLGERKTNDSPISNPKENNEAIQLRELTNAEKSKLDIDCGLYVISVKPQSSIAKAGISAGSVILSYDKKELKTVQEFFDEYNKTEQGKSVLLKVLSGNGLRYVAFTK